MIDRIFFFFFSFFINVINIEIIKLMEIYSVFWDRFILIELLLFCVPHVKKASSWAIKFSMTMEKRSTTSSWIDGNIYLYDNLSNEWESFFSNLWQWSLWHAWMYCVNLVWILSAYTTLCMDPKKRLNVYSVIYVPHVKCLGLLWLSFLWQCTKEKKKLRQVHEYIWHCLFLQNIKQLIMETFHDRTPLVQ